MTGTGAGTAWRFVQDKGRRKKIYKGYRGIDVRLQNLVATTDLRADLNLETIQHQVRNAEYNPAKFAACVIRIREPRATALVFESGKMVVPFVASADNLADFFTKALDGPKFFAMRDRIMNVRE